MSIGREWAKTIQNTSKLLRAIVRGIGVPTFKLRSKSSATPIIVHQTIGMPMMSYRRMIADIEWKKSQAYMVPTRNLVR